MRTALILLTGLVPLAAHPVVQAEVTGRYVRFEAPASPVVSVYEIEVWSEGGNIALRNESLVFTGTGHQGRDINFRRESRKLVDGLVDRSQRALVLGTEQGVNPWVEIDLGGEHPLERIVVEQPQSPHYHDRAVRMLTVLDARRRVVYTEQFDIRRPPFNEGVADLAPEPRQGPLVGRHVPEDTAQWVPLGDLLEAEPMPAPPDAAERAAAFEARDSGEAIEELARQFFARMDLAKPELAGVRERYERGEYRAALDAYRDHFFRKILAIEFLANMPPPELPYRAAADDLLRNIVVVFSRSEVVGEQFTAGAIPWAAVPESDRGGVELARIRARVGAFQQPLLTAYRDTGRPELLAQWAAISDDWGLNIRRDLAGAGEDLRFYFVTDPIQQFKDFADELAQTARSQPDFTRRLSGATLARLLIPVLEEYPPAYWWPCRRTSFNHTYNGLNAATVVSRVLDDFHAGQRLDRENRQHWQRVWTAKVTRDGSMNEIGDEGHLDMHWRMGIFFNQMQKTPPPWFTPDFAAEFETGWRQTTRYPVRHLPPDGREHRLGRRLAFDRIWQLTEPICWVGGGRTALETVDSTETMRDPEVAAIMQSIFGAGLDRDQLSPQRQEIYDRVTAYYGEDYAPPETLSDWMPYAGLHYLRRSWEPDATFVAMISQPKDHPGTNMSAWNTEFHLFDHGQPLVGCSPVWVEGRPPFNEAGKLTFKPGSKTESLAVASERPIDARWHTSSRFDYAESFYEGTYQRHGVDHRAGKLNLGDSPVENARAERRIILVRPLRLVIVTDAVRVPRRERPWRYEVRQRFALPDSEDSPDSPAGTVEGAPEKLTLINENAPGVTVRRFTGAQLTWNPRDTPELWSGGAAMMNHTGVRERMGGILRAETQGNLLMSALIEPHAAQGETAIQSVADLTAEGRSGFLAALHDGTTLTWLATEGEARPLSDGGIELQGEGLLVLRRGDEVSGLMLGAESLRLGGRTVELPAADFEFTLDDGKLADLTVIHRPIQPVRFSPEETVFTGSQQVTLHSDTPDVEIRYTLDGQEPDGDSPLYRGPITITRDTFLRARAFRPGVRKVPFSAAGTEATVVSDARYHRQELQPAVAETGRLEPGLNWELVEDHWFALFSHLHLPQVMPARAAGHTEQLLDLSMRQGNGQAGIRYEGFLQVPADGVWTFHAPSEYVGASCEPGYDLRVWINGEEWDLGQRFHGRGGWSVALSQGLHRIRVTFADARRRDGTMPNTGLWRGYPTPWVVHQGDPGPIAISGPGMEKSPIPQDWLLRRP